MDQSLRAARGPLGAVSGPPAGPGTSGPAPRGWDADCTPPLGHRGQVSANSRLARGGDNDPVSPVLLKIFF